MGWSPEFRVKHLLNATSSETAGILLQCCFVKSSFVVQDFIETPQMYFLRVFVSYGQFQQKQQFPPERPAVVNHLEVLRVSWTVVSSEVQTDDQVARNNRVCTHTRTNQFPSSGHNEFWLHFMNYVQSYHNSIVSDSIVNVMSLVVAFDKSCTQT